MHWLGVGVDGVALVGGEVGLDGWVCWLVEDGGG